MRYPVVVHKDPNSDYGVTVPDLPGCFSAGETMDEALQESFGIGLEEFERDWLKWVKAGC